MKPDRGKPKNRERGEASFRALLARLRDADDSYLAGTRKTPVARSAWNAQNGALLPCIPQGTRQR